MTPTIPGLCERCQVNAIQNGHPFCDECRSQDAYNTHAAEVSDDIGVEVGPPEWDESCLYGPIGDVVHAVAPQTEAHPAAIYAVLLARFGCSAGFGKYIGPNPKIPARIYPFLCGPSGWGRKGTASQVGDTLWTPIDSDLRVVNGISSGQGLIEIIRDRTADPKDTGGTDDKRMYVVEEELSKLRAVKEMKGATTGDTLKQLFDHREKFDNPRVCAAKVTRPHVACEVHATPAAWCRLPDDDISTGFTNRFFHVWTTATKELPRGGDWLNDEVRRALVPVRQALAEVWRWGSDCCLAYSSAAGIAWDERYHETRLLVQARGDHLLNDLLTRGPDQIARITAITAMSQQSKTLPEEGLIAASKYWDFSRLTVEFLFSRRRSESSERGVQWMETKTTADNGAKLMSALFRAAKNGLSMKAIHDDVFNNNLSAAAVRKLVDSLAEHGHVVVAQYKPAVGRPGTKVWAKGYENVGTDVTGGVQEVRSNAGLGVREE